MNECRMYVVRAQALESQTEAEVWGALANACEDQRATLAVTPGEEERAAAQAGR